MTSFKGQAQGLPIKIVFGRLASALPGVQLGPEELGTWRPETSCFPSEEEVHAMHQQLLPLDEPQKGKADTIH